MHACVLRQTGPIESQPLRWEVVPDPEPGPEEALLRVRVCGVCRTDLHVIEGELDQTRQKLPVIPGHQVVGEIVRLGSGGTTDGSLSIGDRVGAAWLGRTCGACRFCTSDRENLCDQPQFNGWTRDGGYAELMTAPVEFLYALPSDLPDLNAAPLLCAGIIGYRCLKMTGIESWPGAKLGIYGFGAAGHVAIQLAIARGAAVYVCTRDRERHLKLAEELGAAWTGGATDPPPAKLDAAIVFAPAGEIVPPALQALDKGGRVVCGGIHMSPIPEINYRDLYGERSIVSVMNNTREDGRAFLEEAARAGVQTHVQTFPLDEANAALNALKNDAIRGAAVLTTD